MNPETPSAAPPEATRQLVTFTLADHEFAIDIRQVREVIRMPDITLMPRTPAFVEGVINLRGRILPVLDVKKRVNLPPADVTALTRVVIVDWRQQTLGMLVDSVNEVVRVPLSAVARPPDRIRDIYGRFLEGTVEARGRDLLLLDLERLLGSDDLSAEDARPSEETHRPQEETPRGA